MIRKAIFYLIFISTLAFFYVTCSDVTNAQSYEGKVIKVTDGDSINILHNGETLKIRLDEIDAPERGQPFWRKSREALAEKRHRLEISESKVQDDCLRPKADIQ